MEAHEGRHVRQEEPAKQRGCLRLRARCLIAEVCRWVAVEPTSVLAAAPTAPCRRKLGYNGTLFASLHRLRGRRREGRAKDGFQVGVVRPLLRLLPPFASPLTA